jgi:hypothetical protein
VNLHPLDPRERLIGIRAAQRLMDSPEPPHSFVVFRGSADTGLEG